MRLLRYILPVLMFLGVQHAGAQPYPKREVQTPRQNINKTDNDGKRHGMWLITQEARMGEPAFSEFGSYTHGQKTGPWYKLDEEGALYAMETFRDNIMDGEVKYFERGRMTVFGHYRGINPTEGIDSVIVTDPVTGTESLRAVPKDKATMRHGIWRYYDPGNGRLVREEDYQVDELVFHKDFPLSKEDSAYYEKRAAQLPHKKGNHYKPPARKQVSYIK